MATIAVILLVAAQLGLGLAGAATGASEALQRLRVQGISTKRLLVFGGEDNRVFLGCLTCQEFDKDSVFNSAGVYGSGVYQASIINKIGKFGSPISPQSVCNPIASHPPVVVDGNGAFYGELTVNSIRPKGIRQDAVVAWLTAMCNE